MVNGVSWKKTSFWDSEMCAVLEVVKVATIHKLISKSSALFITDIKLCFTHKEWSHRKPSVFT